MVTRFATMLLLSGEYSNPVRIVAWTVKTLDQGEDRQHPALNRVMEALS
jgi:hypothetical protein